MRTAKEEKAPALIEASMHLGDSYATGFVHEAAWDESDHLVYARIAGRPAFVRAMAAGLLRGEAMKLMPPDGPRYVYGGEEARSVYNRLDRDVGLATYFSTRLFATDGGHSFIVGRDKEFLNRTFYLLLRRRPVVYHESWNIVEVYHRHKFLKEIDGFGVKGYRITWNDREVCRHLGDLVRKGKLRF